MDEQFRNVVKNRRSRRSERTPCRSSRFQKRFLAVYAQFKSQRHSPRISSGSTNRLPPSDRRHASSINARLRFVFINVNSCMCASNRAVERARSECGGIIELLRPPAAAAAAAGASDGPGTLAAAELAEVDAVGGRGLWPVECGETSGVELRCICKRSKAHLGTRISAPK